MANYTIDKLIKALEKIRETHGGRIQVCANAKELLDMSNGVFQIAHISEVAVDYVLQCDGDGFVIQNKDGSERTRTHVVLS